MPGETFDPELFSALQQVAAATPVATTLATGTANRIVGVEAEGIWIETHTSTEKGRGPQLVPAWMIQVAWDHLRSAGELENRYLLATDGLNVKRSSAVCALLAHLPGVSVASSRPIRLVYDAAATDADRRSR